MKPSTFLKSTLILTVATLLSKILGSLFRVPLQNIAGDEVLGIFSLVYPVYMVALILSVAGIPIAISKLIAEARASGTKQDIYYIQKTARILGLLLGAISLSFILLFSRSISQLIGGISTEPALIAVSFTLLFAPYMAVHRGFFQGYEDMRPTAVSQVIEQFIRVIFIIGVASYMVSLGYNPPYIAAGVMVSSLLGVLSSMVYLKTRLYRSHIKVDRTYNYNLNTFKIWGKRILSVSLPIAIGTVTMALFNVVDSLTVPHFLRTDSGSETTYLYGIYGRGLAVVQIATVFATSVVLPLIPSLTKHLESKNINEARKLIETTRWATHVLSWPAAVLLFILAVPINIALFTNTEGSLMLSITGFSSVFISMTLVGTAILQGMNASRLAATIILFGTLFKAIANAVLVPFYSIEGAAAATLITYLFIVVINNKMIRRLVEVPVIPVHLLKILVMSALLGGMTATTYLLANPFEWSRVFSFSFVAMTGLLFVAIYFLSLLKLKAFDYEMIQHVPFLSKWLK
ncbi:oligosaccharide flippase family protein [Halobacillus litoralis]|uniref:Oligosaccharide flippase family protein n=1 Tax=Halobacillus litoralis TaxID=45668 RepID=A0A845E5D3_9BACI|nr:oligosaccharide flippase family protein [Halobacillus litoralis]